MNQVHDVCLLNSHMNEVHDVCLADSHMNEVHDVCLMDSQMNQVHDVCLPNSHMKQVDFVIHTKREKCTDDMRVTVKSPTIINYTFQFYYIINH